MGLPWWLSDKRILLKCRRCGFYPWVRKIPWRRKWQPPPVFLPGKSRGQWSLEGYSPYGSQELDTTEQARMHLQDEKSHRDRNRRKPSDDRGRDWSFASCKPRNTKDREFPEGRIHFLQQMLTSCENLAVLKQSGEGPCPPGADLLVVGRQQTHQVQPCTSDPVR